MVCGAGSRSKSDEMPKVKKEAIIIGLLVALQVIFNQ
jgi:hypothetical protein